MLEDLAEGAGSAGPHVAIEADGEDVVGAVVGGSDVVEHLLDVLRGGLFGGGAEWAGSGGLFVFGDSREFHCTNLMGRSLVSLIQVVLRFSQSIVSTAKENQ